jgi:hypothetical protein
MTRIRAVMLLVCAALAGCSTTQRAEFYLPMPPSGVTAQERGLGVVFVAEPFCMALSEGLSANIRLQSMGPALLPIIPLGNAIHADNATDAFILVIEIIGDRKPSTLTTQGLALRFDDGSLVQATSAQVSYFSTQQKVHWTPIGNRDRDEIAEYHHDAPTQYTNLPPTLEIADTVRLTLTFSRPSPTADPATLEFPTVLAPDGDWHMPKIKFSHVTRTKYNPGGGMTADGVAAGSLPVTLCRKLGHAHD